MHIPLTFLLSYNGPFITLRFHWYVFHFILHYSIKKKRSAANRSSEIPGADIAHQEIIFPLDNCHLDFGTTTLTFTEKFQSEQYIHVTHNTTRGIPISRWSAPEIWRCEKARRRESGRRPLPSFDTFSFPQVHAPSVRLICARKTAWSCVCIERLENMVLSVWKQAKMQASRSQRRADENFTNTTHRAVEKRLPVGGGGLTQEPENSIPPSRYISVSKFPPHYGFPFNAAFQQADPINRPSANASRSSTTREWIGVRSYLRSLVGGKTLTARRRPAHVSLPRSKSVIFPFTFECFSSSGASGWMLGHTYTCFWGCMPIC